VAGCDGRNLFACAVSGDDGVIAVGRHDRERNSSAGAAGAEPAKPAPSVRQVEPERSGHRPLDDQDNQDDPAMT
jgi:hypothetical protein